MPPKRATVPNNATIVNLDSSDEEDAVGISGGSSSKEIYNAPKDSKSAKKPPAARAANPTIKKSSDNTDNGAFGSRSFWKAAAYEVRPIKATSFQGDLEHARVHPKFLHSNATSHKWAFGAIAELLDNAVDEIGNGATFVKVDRIYNKKDNSPALLFQDDGGGMSPESIRKCMSLGYSTKTTNSTIGQYGNGFKTSTMRLGADVIVFSRSSQSGQSTQSVGLLSYTFLRQTGQDDVIVPMIDFDTSDHWAEPIIHSSQEDWSSNLKTILEWSPFATKDELMLQFQDIGSHGTKIIIYNLWLNDEGIYELSFDDDDEDIRLRDEANRGNPSKFKRVLELQSHISYRLRYSLKAYVSILYLRKITNFKIILRGKPVEQFSIADDLKHTEVITYRPSLGSTSKEVTIDTTIGFIKEAPALGVCGFNIYHKNRLIRPFWKVTRDGTSKGHGVVGVLEANFIEPAHDKQDFERSSLFFRLEMRLKQMIMDYWKGHCHLIGLEPPGSRKHNVQTPSTSPQIPSIQKQPTMGPVQQNVGRTVNLQHQLSDVQVEMSNRSNLVEELPAIPRPEDEFVRETYIDDSRSIDQICEENIQLFMRCEEYVQKENELKRKIKGLENKLGETREKCAKLSAYLESQRKQTTVE